MDRNGTANACDNFIVLVIFLLSFNVQVSSEPVMLDWRLVWERARLAVLVVRCPWTLL